MTLSRRRAVLCALLFLGLGYGAGNFDGPAQDRTITDLRTQLHKVETELQDYHERDRGQIPTSTWCQLDRFVSKMYDDC